ncbi:nuclear transport factor 2 family protein [Aquimarina intermedia]|uniref:Uncharacterized protein DUF4440 n=1 Tax=Aquimarina intermedia TaxID=350814 RepID=A0A5S5BUD3_9FLAO|nr:nuclear transport factor 2 family protein [Aquimarina intermedia]TYP69916.1 uncharacterized protein DUF4440 [Aquimarina intermedia]
MFKKLSLVLLLLIGFTNQINAQNLNNLKQINEVWDRFYQAFDSLDHRLMAEIHSKKLIRISGGKRIIDYDTYINNYKTTFENAKNDSLTNTISLRFFERINNDSIASERGIYKLVRIKSNSTKQTYYGKFHVLLKKEGDIWKIFMDYDSNEANSIGQKDYLKAFGLYDFDKYTSN